METYKFPVKDCTYQMGYTIITVNNNLAEIDEKDPQALDLAERYGGIKVEKKEPAKQTAKRGKE